MESMQWRRVGSSNPETHRSEQTDDIVRDWERHYAVAAELSAEASKFRIKLAQDAVAVGTSAFYAGPFFERATFQRRCLGEPASRQSDPYFSRNGQANIT